MHIEHFGPALDLKVDSDCYVLEKIGILKRVASGVRPELTANLETRV